MEHFASYVALGALVMQLVLLAVALGFAGVGVNRLINRILASRTESKMNSAAVVARARAHARSQARASAAF